ncbi:MAG TPA: hypothetical protein DCQ83_08365 [Fibrobacteres bacterium]|jgi:hypothetical protein|nr:hypothetical protein [Fibrobacterota bacterium]
MDRKLRILFAASMMLTAMVSAQDSVKVPLEEQISNVKGQIDGLNEDYLAAKATVDGLSKLKFGGYIQAQWQHTGDFGLVDSTSPADTVNNATFNGGGSPTVAGGNFPGQANQRFQIRRARLKATYSGLDSKYVLEIDALPSGISVKDIYVQLTEPWLKTFSLTMGNMDMPFGFEIGYSSGAMESPERSRLENNIFKGEKQLGAKIEVNPTEKMGLLQYINLKAGLYTGTEGGTGGTGDEVDRKLEFIGRAGFKAPFNDLGLDIDGGVSWLMGKTQTGSDSVFKMSGDTGFVPTTGNKPKWGEWKYFDRKAMGVDAQLYYDIPVIGGLSLRGEYVQGTEPGTAGSTNAYTNAGATDTVDATAGKMYIRKFSGFYVQWVQNLGPKLQSVLRFDQYDPNTDAKGTSIGDASISNHLTPGTKVLNLTDLKYTTLGLGLTYYWDANLKFLVYYDIPTNEKINSSTPTNTLAKKNALLPYTKDIDDNVLTVRMQVKF